jgi:hypothetical protein
METLQVGSEAWQRWLDIMRTTTFRFVHRRRPFTACRRMAACWQPSSIGRPRDTTWWSGHS